MPLKAIVDNNSIIASFMNDSEWEELKLRVETEKLDVIIGQTGKLGYLRRSKLGVKHFVHIKGQKPDNWKPESAQHLLAKSEILRACQDVGWIAQPEYAEDDWIADVLSVKDNKRIAFEVQWSKQSYKDTVIRQDKYIANEVRGCWFFKSPPKEIGSYYNGQLRADKKLPLFQLLQNEQGNMVVKLNNEESFDLYKFTKMLLLGKFTFSELWKSAINQKIEIGLYPTHCYHCSKEQHVYFINDELETVCQGAKINRYGTLWSEDRGLKFNPQLIEKVQLICKKNGFQLSPVKKRYSRTTNSKYWAFGCYKCNALFGDYHMMEEKSEIVYTDLVKYYTVDIELDQVSEEGAHWCLDRGNGFCST